MQTRLHNHGLDDFKSQLADLQMLLGVRTLDKRSIAQRGTTVETVQPLTMWLNLGQVRGHNFGCGRIKLEAHGGAAYLVLWFKNCITPKHSERF